MNHNIRIGFTWYIHSLKYVYIYSWPHMLVIEITNTYSSKSVCFRIFWHEETCSLCNSPIAMSMTYLINLTYPYGVTLDEKWKKGNWATKLSLDVFSDVMCILCFSWRRLTHRSFFQDLNLIDISLDRKLFFKILKKYFLIDN